MPKLRLRFLAPALMLALATSVWAQLVPEFKQLAGPIEEVRSGPMAPVDPAANAHHGRGAMIPVTLSERAGGGWAWEGELVLDGESFNMVLFDGGERWTPTLVAPDSKRALSAHELADEISGTELSLGSEGFTGTYYRFTAARSGSWRVVIEADAPLGRNGYLLYASDSPYRLRSFNTQQQTLIGNEITYLARGLSTESGHAIIDGLVEKAWLRVTTPDGEVFDLSMQDRGLTNDGSAGDGVFGGSFVPELAGDYMVQVIARGTTPEGRPFLRTAEHVMTVIPPDLAIARDIARAFPASEKRLRVSVPVDDFGTVDKVRVIAEVWGNRQGEMVGTNWIGGMARVENGSVALGLDSRWLARAGVTAPFELRNVRIENADTFIAYDTADRMKLVLPESIEIARFEGKRVDEEMLMGPRPARPAHKAGSRLLLVHGYCSGNAWGPVSSQFSSASIFQDYSQNRSHDQFAQLIKSFGSSYSSYGIVAHSQGGAASLHLYTYYWSGLDYASGNRLIQSVGTPYQGTSLAGNIAALGSIFGAGCGANNDLTYSGASSWLSGIPTWARGEVTYFTTSFEDRWWAYDYCHLASDLILSDPDDGTTEKAKGQLSYANNGGHETGWCHTTGMRDPAQVTDSSRNSSMNSNAAR